MIAFCCCLDYQITFVPVDRYKLFILGKRGKLLSIIKPLYAIVRASVLLNGFITDDFDKNNKGLMQCSVTYCVLFLCQ